MRKQVLLKRSTFAVLMVAMFAVLIVQPTLSATAEITGFSITPSKAAYYIGETPTVTVKFTYKNVANNTALKIEIYNSSNDLVFTISGITLIGDASLLNGTYEQQHNLASNFTEKTGSETYTAKLIDVSTGYKLGETSFTINVETESILLVVSWLDASQDRVIEVNEYVTFSVFTQWSFVNESKSATLYAKYGGNEYTIDTVSITAGSGQESDTWQTAFSSEGTHVITFELRDSDGDILAKTTVTITVGQQEEAETTIWDIINANLPYIAIACLLVIIIILVVKERK